MIQCLQDDNIDEIDDYKQKYENISKLISKLENIKQEYASITKMIVWRIIVNHKM